jgi:hypothetical protein
MPPETDQMEMVAAASGPSAPCNQIRSLNLTRISMRSIELNCKNIFYRILNFSTHVTEFIG